MGRVVAVANQKGGVAKTTTVAGLAEGFAMAGLRVLAIDLDSQACLSFSFACPVPVPENTSAALMLPHLRSGSEDGAVDGSAGTPVGIDNVARSLIQRTEFGVDIIPAGLNLAELDMQLAVFPQREQRLRRALEPILHLYDVILLDCPPALGLNTINAFTASNDIVIPMQCELLAHRGVGQLLDTVADVITQLNSNLRVAGILPTMFDARTVQAHSIVADAADRYGVPVFYPPVPRSVRVAEAPAVGGSILRVTPRSAAAYAYRQLVANLLESWGMAAANDSILATQLRQDAERDAQEEADEELASALLDVRESERRRASTRRHGRHRRIDLGGVGASV